ADDVVIMEQVCVRRSAAGGPEGERYNLCLRDGRYTSQGLYTEVLAGRRREGGGGGERKTVSGGGNAEREMPFHLKK
ncbi:hypothetical protein KUCAC02_015372, partial [Chaenocephalus aceratus]